MVPPRISHQSTATAKAPLCKGGCLRERGDWGIVIFTKKTTPPSFCSAKIHLPLHRGGFSPAVHFCKKDTGGRLPPLQCCRKIVVTVLPPSDEGGGFCRRQKTEGENNSAELEVSLSLPQSSLTLRQLPRQREPKSKRRREKKVSHGSLRTPSLALMKGCRGFGVE